jgi:hypothetical protein
LHLIGNEVVTVSRRAAADMAAGVSVIPAMPGFYLLTINDDSEAGYDARAIFAWRFASDSDISIPLFEAIDGDDKERTYSAGILEPGGKVTVTDVDPETGKETLSEYAGIKAWLSGERARHARRVAGKADDADDIADFEALRHKRNKAKRSGAAE